MRQSQVQNVLIVVQCLDVNMMMTANKDNDYHHEGYDCSLNTEEIIRACYFLSHKIVSVEGIHSGSIFQFLFNQCMMVFTNKNLPAEAITFSVYFNVPVMKDGEATIYRDGKLEMHTI